MADKKTILVVDDDPMQLVTMKSHLKEYYDVVAVNSGKACLKYFENHTCDMIFLDFLMPELSGAQVYYKLRDNEKTKDIPVVFLTGLSEKKVILKTLTELKPQGYIVKPATKKQLLKKVIDTLD